MTILKRLYGPWSPTGFDLVFAFSFGIACAHIVPIWSVLEAAAYGLIRALAALDGLTLPRVPDEALIGMGVLLGIGALVVLLVRLGRPAGSVPASRSARVVDGPEAVTGDASTQQPGQELVVAQVNAQLEEQLAALLSFISQYLEKSDASSSSLSEARCRLKSAASVEQIRSVIQLLVTQHEEEQRNTRELRSRLEEAQTHSEAMNERLVEAEIAARLDALTSVANRRWLETFLEEHVSKSHVEASPLCVVMTDIDHFKKINDTFGHPTGDEVIKKFSRLLSENVRPTDLVARYGGEEFAIVFPRTASGNAFQLVERIRGKLQKTKIEDLDTGKPIGTVTASFGIAEIHENETPTDLIRRADRKLYESKRKGRNRTETETVS